MMHVCLSSFGDLSHTHTDAIASVHSGRTHALSSSLYRLIFYVIYDFYVAKTVRPYVRALFLYISFSDRSLSKQLSLDEHSSLPKPNFIDLQVLRCCFSLFFFSSKFKKGKSSRRLAYIYTNIYYRLTKI